MDLLSLGKLGYASQRSEPAPTAKPRLIYEACPLCGSRETALLREADCSKHALYIPVVPPTMRWMRCAGCEHVFTDGYFSPEVIDDVFKGAHPNQMPGWNFEQQRMVSARMVERVARRSEIGRWLDVGFGNGSLLFTAAEWGFTPVGLDLRPACVKAMADLGFEAYCQDIATFDQVAGVSVVSMADVLEHMPYPKIGLQAAHRLLKPGGTLFVSMPHYGCPAWQLLDRAAANPYWGELEHYHNFSRDRLSALLRETGFEPLDYSVSERYRVCMEQIARRID